VISLPVTTAVTCPTTRIHPAVIAQAATANPDRSILSSGSSAELASTTAKPFPGAQQAGRARQRP
jgi:hypothetical protein